MKHFVLAIFFLLTAFSSAAASDGNIVTLHENASIYGSSIHLGDIADVVGPNEKDLAALDVEKAPAGTHGAIFSADRVMNKIRESHPDWPVAMKGSSHVNVCRKLVKISGKELETLFRDAVTKASPWKENCEMAITDFRAPQVISVPEEGKEGLQAKFSRGEDFLGLVTATISLRDESSPLCRVSGKIHVMANVPVTQKAIPRGAVISQADIETKPLDISAYPLAVTTESECLGKRAKTMLQPGRPVLRTNIEQPPLIRKGDIVAIEARSEGLVVQDRGIALKDGYLSERIPVRNAGSGKQVTGIIIAHSLVEVPF